MRTCLLIARVGVSRVFRSEREEQRGLIHIRAVIAHVFGGVIHAAHVRLHSTDNLEFGSRTAC